MLRKIAPAIESQSKVNKQSLKSHPSNKVNVLLDSWLDGDLYFLPKGKDKPFPTLLGRCQSLDTHEMGASKQLDGGETEQYSLIILQEWSISYSQIL